MSWFVPKVREVDFMSELDAATRLRPALPATAMLFSVVALVTLGIVWAAVSKVEILTRAQGVVVPSRDVQFVQSLEGGIIEEIFVQPGDIVEKGQVLLRLSDVQFSSEARGTEARFLSLQAKRARLKAEAAGTAFLIPPEIVEKLPPVAANEEALYESRQKELQSAFSILDDRIRKAGADLAETSAQIARLSESRKSLQKELVITRDMVAKRAVPKLEEMRLSREIEDIAGQINAQSQRRKALEAELQVTKREREAQIDRFRSQALGEMSAVETEIAGLRESMTSIGDRVDRREVRAPVAGIVNNIAVRTIGGVIEPAMRLVEIVPLDDELKIIAKVQPGDIAFIRSGQAAKVKITAYDAQIYGFLQGKLTRVGATSSSDREGHAFFEIEVRTDKNHLGGEDGKLPVSPGMEAQVEVVVGKRTILNYLMKPLVRARERVLTER
ncbi:MAG: HlyD family type I secretion periplasmic adaptor subunit [Alphaproteobacteria bacterium]|nr:HlyD family type I secretion periplasmic adaptor subunit [Alphaproteobacteria bacterium]